MSVKTASENLASYWHQQIEALQSSGQTQQAYCKANELSYHRFGYWLRKFRRQAQPVQSRKGSGFARHLFSVGPICRVISGFAQRSGASWHCG